MQAAAGGKGRGANGMPTPAQIQAMQVSAMGTLREPFLNRKKAVNATRDVATNAEADAWRWRHAGDDEGHDAGPGRRPDGRGGNATNDGFYGKRTRRSRRAWWARCRHARYGGYDEDDGHGWVIDRIYYTNCTLVRKRSSSNCLGSSLFELPFLNRGCRFVAEQERRGVHGLLAR